MTASGRRRLFAALPVPPVLTVQMDGLPRTLAGARWLPGAALHVTLRFLGDVEAEREEEAVAALARVRKKPFHVEVSGLDVFDQPGDAVLFAPVQSVRNVTDLAARVADVLVPLGFDFGARPYVPHVTLARVPDGRSLPNYIKKYCKSISCSWLAESFGLYVSAGTAAPPGGYEERAVFPLEG